MQQLSEQEIIAAIETGMPFSAVIDSGAFSISVNNFVPVVATAIHDGHAVLPALAAKYSVDEYERFFEEDPFTGQLAGNAPVSIVVNDSRFMYDLNRKPETCIYTEAWGKSVWQQALTMEEKEVLLERHATYYRVLDALLGKLAKDFGCCLIYDLHSYNYKRHDGSPPLFNIGTHFINRELFGPFLESLSDRLQDVSIESVENRTVFDEVFQGKGYQAEFVRTSHPGCLCIPLEVKKVFMEEESGRLYPPVFQSLGEQLDRALGESGAWFFKNHCR